MPEVPQRVGRYEVQEVVGELPPALVLRARDSSNQRVRIHWYESASEPELEELARFGAVLERVRKLGPEACVLPIVEWGASDGVPYVVHPDVAASALNALPELSLSTVDASRLLRDLGNSVLAMRRAGIVHGRLWPGTILRARDNRVFLCHFGIAELLGGTRDRVGPLLDIQELAYMSPEVMRAMDAVPASDAWSLAILAWDLLIGPLPNLRQEPGKERSMFEVLRRTLEEPFVPPAVDSPERERLAREIGAILAAKDPKARPGLVELVRSLLEHAGNVE